MTLREWAEFWWEHYDKPTVRPTTFAAHGYLLKNHILPQLGEIELTTLTENDVREFIEHCKMCGNHKGGTPLSAQTLRHIRSLLSRMLSQAVSDGIINDNPALKVVVSVSKQVKAEPLSDWEVEQYLDAAEELGVLPIFLLALEHGLRQRELIALKWSDLNEQSRILTVHMHRAVEYGRLVDYDGPTRTIQLSDYTTGQLMLLRQRHPGSEAMFVHPGTLKPYSPNMIRRVHSKILEHANLAPVRFADLRHTCAVRGLAEGRPLQLITADLGHTRPATTRRNYREYLPRTEVNPTTQAVCEGVAAEQKRAAEMLSNALLMP